MQEYVWRGLGRFLSVLWHDVRAQRHHLRLKIIHLRIIIGSGVRVKVTYMRQVGLFRGIL